MTTSEQWTFKKLSQDDVKAGGRAGALALAEMSYSAACDFYDLIPLPHDGVLELISSQLGAPETETSDFYVLSRDGEALALLSALPSEMLVRAKQDATLAIIRGLDRASKARYMASLESYTPIVEPFDVGSFYLTRIAVRAGARRNGAGTAAMQRFIELGAGQLLSLHVKADNIPAISLYQKFGFQFISDGPFRFRAMLKRR